VTSSRDTNSLRPQFSVPIAAAATHGETEASFFRLTASWCFMRRVSQTRLLVLFTIPLLLVGFDNYQKEAERLRALLSWKPGDVIAEIGAGDGQISFAAAKIVGAEGHVYTTELDEKKLAKLKSETASRKLQNVTVVQADAVDTNLPEACCDSVLMRHVYHHFKDPAQTDRSILRALKPNGLLAVIDFPPRHSLSATNPIKDAPSSHGGHGIPRNVLVQELTSAGFEIVNEPEDWSTGDDYCVVARKPAHSN
jgi:SAM-dependent methyltransferase